MVSIYIKYVTLVRKLISVQMDSMKRCTEANLKA